MMIEESNRYDEDLKFARLIDGELSPEEYRALIASLDDMPGGWRRCALAFLESQALNQELCSLSQPNESWQVQPPKKMAARHSPWLRERWQYWVGMAVCFLLAFGLGVLMPTFADPRAWLEIRHPLMSDKKRESVPIKRGEPNATQVVAQDGSPEGFLAGNVQLVLDGPEGTSTATNLPVYEMQGDLANWLSEKKPALLNEVVEALERRGHNVERHQQYVSVPMDDGRQAIIPIEGYEITPVSRQTY